MRDGHIDLLSRIDCAFCSLPPTFDLLSLRAQAAYTRSVYDVRLASDHAPLEFVLHVPMARRSSSLVPMWVAHHPAFQARLDEVYSSVAFREMGPFDELGVKVDGMQKVAREVMPIVRELGAEHRPHWRLHCLSVARSAWGRGDAERVRSALERVPEDADFFLEPDGGLRRVVANVDVVEALASAQRAAITADVCPGGLASGGERRAEDGASREGTAPDGHVEPWMPPICVSGRS